MQASFPLRRVPPAIRSWVESEAERQKVPQNQIVLAALKAAVGRGQLTLFEPPRTETPKLTTGPVPFSFIDLFAGIGGMRLGLEGAGGSCLFSCEWDKNAQKTYQRWFGEEPFGDIRELDASVIPRHIVLAAGFPCQPFSIAGVSKKKSLGREHGFKDETQGTLFFHLAEIIEAVSPPVVLLENVKNLRTHDRGHTWAVIRNTLEELGYEVHAKIIDAAGWVPQHRERFFIVGFLRATFGEGVPFRFPKEPETTRVLRDILEPAAGPQYTLSNRLWGYLRGYKEKHRLKGNGFGYQLADLDGITRTLSARYHKDGSEILIPTARGNPRRLTPREAARLMGFPDERGIFVSDTQAYRQFGNAVVPAVVTAVGHQIGSVIAWNLAGGGRRPVVSAETAA